MLLRLPTRENNELLTIDKKRNGHIELQNSIC